MTCLVSALDRATAGASEGPTMITITDIYKETMAQVRYYGGVRYALLPAYFVLMCALAKPLVAPDGHPVLDLIRWFICFVGALLSFIFLFFEYALSSNLRVLWQEIDKMTAGVLPPNVDALAHRRDKPGHGPQLRHLRWFLHAPYYVGFASWAGALLWEVGRTITF
jgi:hypothetical protein